MAHLQPFTAEMGFEALCSLTGIRPTNEKDSIAAKEICHLLGGLPLAIVQISEVIRDRGCSYEEFLQSYRSFAAEIHAGAERPVEYNRALSTVSELSLHTLPENATLLQNLIVFFEADGIEERLLRNPTAGLTDERFEFLQDDFEFGEAVSALIRSSLVNRSSAREALSVHRLVQAAVFARLSKDQMILFLDSTITILSNGFPNTWRKAGHQQGHGWSSWATCSKVLPHVNWLIDLVTKHKLKASYPELFAELVFRSGTYLWERDQPSAAQSFFTFGLSLDVDREGPICNPAVRLLGHIALDMAQPRTALAAYNEALAARLKLVGPDDPIIADLYDSIACSYTEMDNTTKAFEYLDKASRIHHAKDPQKMGRTNAIFAMTFLRAGKPDQALGALKDCWRLQDLTEEEVALSNYPKHSGDIVLLSRIQAAQGHRESALELASKSITIRQGILGNKGPRVADSMYLVASMLRDDRKEASAAKMLREIVDMSQGMVDMEGHLARALWTLAGVEEEIGNRDEAEALRSKAREAREKIKGRETEDEDTNEGFSKLVGYMLW
ncbi:MAG: hypothetical protein M1837_000331 [Sclerophora amabilis]|nr:MAG: hypothetical protein M1837_000331 [Sclerophora amabilis]